MLAELKKTTIDTANSLSICMVSDDFLPSATGVGSHLQVVAAELAKRGHQVAVITARQPNQPQFEIWQGVRIYRTRTIKLFGFYQAMPSVADVKKILDEVKPDRIHYHYLSFLLLRVLKISLKMGIPSVYTYHMSEVVLTQPWCMRPFRSIIAKKIVSSCNQFDHIISVSKNLANKLPKTGIKKPITYISNPIIFSSKNDFVVNKKSENFTILFAGRLDPEKNIPYLFRAFKKLLETKPEAKLLIAGRGTQLNNLEKLSVELGIQNKITFLGFLTHEALSKYYASCDVFVLPSIFETQGLVAMEAMWFGKPVIVTDQIVSAEELVDHGINGYIVKASSYNDLAHRLQTLANDPVLRAKMGEAGRERAKDYQPEIVMDALESGLKIKLH
jgi:glycosyltransferase involved in cell wall biosynthesis